MTRRKIGFVAAALIGVLCVFPPRDRGVLSASQGANSVQMASENFSVGIYWTSERAKIRRLGEAMSSHSWIPRLYQPVIGAYINEKGFRSSVLFRGRSNVSSNFLTDKYGISSVNGWLVTPSIARKIRNALGDIHPSADE